VTLERRDRRLYYYRSVRDGGNVRKVYVGTGEIARISHEADVLTRTGREADRRREKAELERLENLAAPVVELSEAAKILAHAYLIACGYHRRKGEYRRARGEARSA
jgi:hypothetical protein